MPEPDCLATPPTRQTKPLLVYITAPPMGTNVRAAATAGVQGLGFSQGPKTQRAGAARQQEEASVAGWVPAVCNCNFAGGSQANEVCCTPEAPRCQLGCSTPHRTMGNPQTTTQTHMWGVCGPAESAWLCWQTPLTTPHSPPWTLTTPLLMLSACTPLHTPS